MFQIKGKYLKVGNEFKDFVVISDSEIMFNMLIIKLRLIEDNLTTEAVKLFFHI